MPEERLPRWVAGVRGDPARIRAIKRLLRSNGLHTVCESARCPNLGECFSQRTATFMILGNDCTRKCAFCAVGHGEPAVVDPGEPLRITEAAGELGLRHVVVTSVTRDDLPDGGSGHFAETIRCLRAGYSEATIEVLTPDFRGDGSAVRRVSEAGPDIYNHNVETVPRLYSRVRPAANYRRSLELLLLVKRCRPELKTKSGIMVGLGETREEVISVMQDLRGVGCDLLTVGQYLRPGKRNLPVVEYLPKERFTEYAQIGYASGFRQVMSGPLVRSSFHAGETALSVASERSGSTEG